ncbi:MAG: hypothetical protein ACFFD1_15315, partial [Candidatus Thorarchaeota archaeon]
HIPTIYVPHAAIPIIDELISNSDIKLYALGGEMDKNYYILRGIPEEQIQVVGIPRYEQLYTSNINKLSSIKDHFDEKIYNFSNKKFPILLTTNPIDDASNEKIISFVSKSLKDLNLIKNLIIKLHPNENGLLHQNILKKLNINPIIVKDYSILRLIKSCNLLISQKSTTLLEAMIVGTPMILLDFINRDFRETSRYDFLNEELIISVKNEKQLTETVKDLFSNPTYCEKYTERLREYASKFSFFDYSQTPTQKIVQMILDYLKLGET